MKNNWLNAEIEIKIRPAIINLDLWTTSVGMMTSFFSVCNSAESFLSIPAVTFNPTANKIVPDSAMITVKGDVGSKTIYP